MKATNTTAAKDSGASAYISRKSVDIVPTMWYYIYNRGGPQPKGEKAKNMMIPIEYRDSRGKLVKGICEPGDQFIKYDRELEELGFKCDEIQVVRIDPEYIWVKPFGFHETKFVIPFEKEEFKKWRKKI